MNTLSIDPNNKYALLNIATIKFLQNHINYHLTIMQAVEQSETNQNI